VQETFKNGAEEELHMSVDERIVPFKGHHVPFKGHHALNVYMKKKPKKWGYKVWAIAGQSGYVHKLYISGDNLMPTDFKDLDPAIGKSGSVVLNLADSLPRGTHLYFDN
jgi:hypothetical protein